MNDTTNTTTDRDESTDGPAILTTAEVSELIHVPVGTLRYWRHQGTGPRSFRLGAKKVMYMRADVESWLRRQYEAGGESE